ncbi:MAG: chlorophyll synthase ChlG [Gemmatimonadales bacterium]|nr:chlorophyll synthase ChlG [Gemmatimonadales bacterium]
MTTVNVSVQSNSRAVLQPRDVLELLKPVTWFPPMWAYMCGAVSSGVVLGDHLGVLLVGIVLTGPLACATSQAVNDWFDRHVDAINEPNRPIPSGRIPGRWGLGIALTWSLLTLAVAAVLGRWGFAATVVGLLFAWAYSMPPVRLKQNGWFGNLAVGLSYESLAWVTGAAVLLATVGAGPDARILVVALLYGLGAHGIMTINDYKSIEGDRAMGVRSLPVQLGPERAARVCCAVMLVPQLAVLGLLMAWDRPLQVVLLAAFIIAQVPAMGRWLTAPRALAPWYNGTGVTAYVSGMLTSAFALRGLAG